MRTASLICIGHVTLDRIYGVAGFPLPPGKQRAPHALEVGGGMAASAAVAAARLGGRVAIWGRIGDDLAGRAIRAELLAEGVDCAALREVPGAVSSTSAILVDPAGERLIVNHRGEGLDPDPSWLPFETIAGAGAVLADLRWPEAALAAFAAARRQGVPTVLDADVGGGAALAPLLALTDHAVFSAPGLEEFAPGPPVAALEAALAAGAREAGVTQGALGYLRLAAGAAAPERQPGFDVAAVDTTGAGDAFHGAYALAIAEGLGTAAAALRGAAAAALKCTRPGTRAGLPRRRDLEAFLLAQMPSCRQGACREA